MKRSCCWMLLSCCVLTSAVFAADPPPGITVTTDAGGYLVTLALPELRTSTIEVAGQAFTLPEIPGYGTTSDAGMPQLPLVSFNLMIGPAGAAPAVTVLSQQHADRTLSQKVYPAQEPWPKSRPLSERPFRINNDYYRSRVQAAAPLITVSEPFSVGGTRGVTVTIAPVAYDPAADRLRLTTTATFRVSLAGSPSAAAPCSPSFNAYLQEIFVNYLPAAMLTRSNYLIITAPEFASALAPFVTHKQGLGYDVVVTTTGVTGTTNTAIKSYIQQRYDNPATRPEFILLVGDMNRVPGWVGTTSNNPYTDLYYTRLDGPDYYADAHIGRFPVDSVVHLSNAITKSIFMENAIFALEKRNVFMASTDNWNITEGTHNFVIDSFFVPAGYQNTKRYTHTYNATTAEVIADLNAGQIFAIYSGHGSTTSWADGPPFSQSNVRSLVNNVYPHVYSFACLTGEFDAGECFGETWIRIPRGGASFWGSSVTSYWDEDDILEKRLFRAMFTDRLTQSTPMFNMAKVSLAAHYGGITPTVQRYFEMYNLLGDPSIHTASFTANFGWVQGTVTSGGAPLAGVEIDFVEGIPQQGGFTGSDGAYLAGARVDTAATTMLVNLRARKFGYITVLDTLTLVREDTVERSIVLNPAAGGTLQVHTFTADSSALGAAVHVVFEGTTVVSDSTAGATGLFTAPLPAGDYTVRIDAPNPYATRVFTPVVIDSGVTTALEVLLRYVVEPSPAALAETLVVGQIGTQSLVLTNSTPDSVPFRLSDDSALKLRQRAPGTAAQPRAVPILPIELPKGSQETSNPPVTKGRGGPDNFGYRWIDSDEPDGPAFVWRDIRGLGTAIAGLGDDTNVGPFPLGFSFPYYGNSYDAVRFCTNGWISFTSTGTAYSDTAIPAAAEPNNTIYAFWDDLTFSSGGGTAHYYFDASAMEFIVQYTAVPHIGGDGPFTFQIVLRPDGEILYRYLSMLDPLNEATIGIENADGTDGLQIAFNAAYVRDSLAVRFFLPDAPWVSENPVYGVVPPLGTRTIDVMFDALDLVVGTRYNALITMDLVHPDVSAPMTIPVTLQVAPADSAVLLLTRGSISFPLTALFVTRTDSFLARNGGALPLTVSSITSTNSDFAVTPANAVIQPGDSVRIRVAYTPTAAGTDTGRIVFLSNSRGSPRMDVMLSGTSVGMPAITVTPSSMTFALPANGDTTHASFTVHNPGTDTLRFMLGEDIPVRTAAMERSREQQVAVEHPKGALEGAGDPPQLLGSGGPDAYGYRWIDSDEPNGPVFSWVDISSTGTPVTTWTGSADDGRAVVPLPFAFPFYGGSYNQVKIVTNGWIGFDVTSTSNAYSNTAIPTTAEPNAAVYLFWDDLTLSSSGSVHYQHDAGGGRFIIQYTNVPHYGSTPGLYTFQVHLYPGGNILVQYLDMQQTLNSATLGIEDAGGIVGLQVAYNAAYLHNNLAVLYTMDMVPWMACAVDHGMIAPGDSMEVDLAIHPAGLPMGQHVAAIRVTGNCPDVVFMPVTLDIVSAAEAGEPLPDRYSLSQNYPNPFNPTSVIRYGVPQSSHVTLALYNLLGQRVALLDEGIKEAGYHEVTVRADGLASGVYVYRLEAGSFVAVKKLILLK